MKPKQMVIRGILIILLIGLVVSLTACYKERGYAYKNLQNMSIGTQTDSRQGLNKTNETVYDELNKNLCGTNPHCCGEFTDQEQKYHDLEQRAIIEKNPRLCLELPDDDLIVKCRFKEPYTYYSKKGCLDKTANETTK